MLKSETASPHAYCSWAPNKAGASAKNYFQLRRVKNNKKNITLFYPNARLSKMIPLFVRRSIFIPRVRMCVVKAKIDLRWGWWRPEFRWTASFSWSPPGKWEGSQTQALQVEGSDVGVPAEWIRWSQETLPLWRNKQYSAPQRTRLFMYPIEPKASAPAIVQS